MRLDSIRYEADGYHDIHIIRLPLRKRTKMGMPEYAIYFRSNASGIGYYYVANLSDSRLEPKLGDMRYLSNATAYGSRTLAIRTAKAIFKNLRTQK